MRDHRTTPVTVADGVAVDNHANEGPTDQPLHALIDLASTALASVAEAIEAGAPVDDNARVALAQLAEGARALAKVRP